MDKIISIDELLKMLEGYSHSELHLHHTWRPNHEIYFKKPDPLYWQEAMRRYHIDTNGWSDIGQHVTLLPDGRFVTGRRFDRNPASIKGYNTKAFAVEMIGDFDIGKDPFDGPQKESALKLARWFDKRGKYIRFHNESSSKTCPGTSINKYDFMREVRSCSDCYALPVLRRGSKGDTVKELQEKLKKLGYYTGEIDGSYGPLTEAAVKAFQKDQKLEQD
ncbi:MAG TPA: N-acetylmuramoyl-L-alanine amidase, partial [Clostridiales bacterium]|nr:N-acetylmuramoyl-L-alanine amidase [Clostridiales bacterium]